ncbi:MAG: DUF4382 domain-containing protein [Halanaerobiaceae bacterium]
MKKNYLITIIIVTIFVLSACSSNNLNDNTSGELIISLSDAPVNDVKEVWVTLEKVQVKRDGYEWETIKEFDIANNEGQFDLLSLRFDEALLGKDFLPTGHYEQIRLIIAADENGNPGPKSGFSRIVYKEEAQKTDDHLFIPSGTQTGLKINHDFIIEEGAITQLLLDVDVSEVMHSAGNSGNIILQPTAIKVIDKIISGNITGQVVADTDDDGADEAITDSDVIIQAFDINGDPIFDQNDNPIKTIASVEEDSTKETPAGSFLLRGLQEGTYTIKAYIADPETGEPDTNNYEISEVNNIEVITEETTEIDTIKLEKKTADTTQ